MRALSATLLTAALLAGCARPGPREAALPAVPGAFKEASAAPVAGPDATAEPQDWWRIFADPVLDRLEERALGANRTLHLAAANLAAARAALRAADASRAPLVSLGLNSTRQEGPLTNAAGTSGPLHVAGLNLSYEIDLFGRLARLRDAAAADLREQEHLLAGARLMVQADLAQAYFTLRALDAEQEILRATAETRMRTLALTEGLARSGLAADLGVARLRAEAQAARAEALALERRRAAQEHAIAVLVGEPASSFTLAPTMLPAAPPVVPPGIPAAVLARRPDIGAAQAAMLAAQTRRTAVGDAWLPRLSLTAVGGLASPDLGTLLRLSAGAIGAGALLSAPLLDGGRHQAELAGVDAALDAAAARYGQQILVALREVEDHLAQLRLLQGQSAAAAEAADAAARSVALVTRGHRLGLASQLEVLDAQRTELARRRETVQAHAERFFATVGLVRALGGGWSAPAAVAGTLPRNG